MLLSELNIISNVYSQGSHTNAKILTGTATLDVSMTTTAILLGSHFSPVLIFIVCSMVSIVDTTGRGREQIRRIDD